MLGGFVDKNFLGKITVDDLKEEIDMIKTFIDKNDGDKKKPRPDVNITEWEKERIEKLELEITDWEAENKERVEAGKKERKTKKKAYRSMSTIFLFDEFEKMSDQGALDMVGSITDREQNWSFMDRYFGFRVDLSRCWILMTANYPEKVPQFIQDRGLLVKIELLT